MFQLLRLLPKVVKYSPRILSAAKNAGKVALKGGVKSSKAIVKGVKNVNQGYKKGIDKITPKAYKNLKTKLTPKSVLGKRIVKGGSKAMNAYFAYDTANWAGQEARKLMNKRKKQK